MQIKIRTAALKQPVCLWDFTYIKPHYIIYNFSKT